MNLNVDPTRYRVVPETGIYVRAMLHGSWGSHDIAELDRASLVLWLESVPNLALNTVLILLGHARE